MITCEETRKFPGCEFRATADWKTLCSPRRNKSQEDLKLSPNDASLRNRLMNYVHPRYFYLITQSDHIKSILFNPVPSRCKM